MTRAYRFSPTTITLIYASFAILWIFGSGSLLEIATTDPVLQSRIEIAKGIAFVIVTSALIYLLLRARRGKPATQFDTTPDPQTGSPLLLALTMLVLTVPMIGFAVFALNARQIERNVLHDLAAVAAFKSHEVEIWLNERHQDAQVLAVSSGFIGQLGAMRQGDAVAGDAVRARLAALNTGFAFDAVELQDADGRARIAIGPSVSGGEIIAALLTDALTDGEVRMSSFYRDDTGRVRLSFAVPLIEAGSATPAAAVLLHANAPTALFPQLLEWPLGGSATLLVEGRTAAVIHLNDGVYPTRASGPNGGTSLHEHRDTTSDTVPASVRANSQGAMTGIGYNGVAVLAAWHPVAGTDWRLVSSRERSAALAPAKATAMWAALAGLLGVVLVGIAMVMLFRQQRLAQRLALEVQADRLLKHFYDLPFIGMAITAPDTQRWLKYNERLCEMFGYTRDELAAKDWRELSHPDDRLTGIAELARIKRGEIDGFALERHFIRKCGDIFVASVDVKCVRKSDGSPDFIVSTIEDITERKAAETRTLRLNRLYRTLSLCNGAIVQSKNEDELFAAVCRAAVESGGLSVAWVGMVESDTGMVRPVASCGVDIEALGDLHVSVDASDPHGRGTVGTAIRENRAVWCHDFQHDPRTAPWHDVGARFGWVASVALPLKRGNQTAGAFMLYTTEADAFDDDTCKLLVEIASDVSYGLDNFALDTAHRRAEEQLRESEERFRSLLQNVPSIAVQSYTMDGTTRYWNRASEQLYGYTAEDAIGANLLDLIIPPEMHTGVKEAMRHMAETGIPVPADELTLMRKDGSRVTVYSSHAAVTVPGREVEMFCIDIDLTARKQAEEAVRAREAEFRTLVEAMPQIVWITGADGEHIHFNQHWMDFTGLTLEESLGFGWNPPFHPQDQAKAALQWQHSINTGDPYEIEYRLRRHDGVYHWMLGRALPLRDEAGNILKWFGTCTDVDDLKRATERLNEAQRIGRIGDWEYDLATRRMDWSPQVYEILGRDSALGPSRDHTRHEEESRAIIIDTVEGVIDAGEPREYELTVHRANGEEVFLQTMAVPRKDDQGRIVGAFGTVQDISLQKRDELALRSRARQQLLVATLGRLALSDATLQEVFDAAASSVAEGLGVEFGRILLAAEDDAFDVRAGVGWAPEWLGRRIRTGMGRTHAGFVIAAKGPVIIDDFGHEGRFAESGMLAAHSIVSGIDAPIGDPDKPLGILSAYSRVTHRFTPDDIGFVQSIANTLNTAIERARASEHLTYMVQHDALTGLPNRLLMTDRLNVAMAHAERSGKQLALMFMDLDRFKNINDVFGHESGDHILREVAARLTQSVRAADTVSRQGGDEFLIVLPEIEADEDAARVAQKLIDAVTAPFRLHGTEIVLGGSVGIVCFPENGRDVETLLRNADAAMYVAKDQGRGRFQFYSAEMNARTHERLMLETDLRHAIERDELFLTYQPQLDLHTGKVVGLEALLRWHHPTLGLIPPGQFIPIAEDSGLIAPIGAWVLETACCQHVQWIAEGLITGTMAVNVSALQFRQPNFVDSVSDVLARCGLDAVHLEIEVTESVVMRGVDEVLHKLRCLDKLGVKLAIDDFGTGYSSLSYLKLFPIFRLKVDQSFTRSLPDDRESAAIVQAIIGLGHSLGLDVLAEGIETEAQQNHLRTMSCNTGQGYLFSRPIPTDECTTYLRAQAGK